MLEEKRAEVIAYMKRATYYFNKRVKHRAFKVEDLMLREVGSTTRKEGEGKLGPSWEGLYVVVASRRPSMYHLKDMNGKKLPHQWNVRKYLV